MITFLWMAVLGLFAGRSAIADDLSYRHFSNIPVQDDGRIKPLDTFARAHLLMFNSRETCEGMPPDRWMAELLFDQARAYSRPCFDLPNPDLVNLLELERRESHRYHFAEIIRVLRGQAELIQSLRQKEAASLTSTQSQLLQLDGKIARYFDLSRSISLLLPIFSVNDPALAKNLTLEPGEKYSYVQIFRLRDPLAQAAGKKSEEAKRIELGLQTLEKGALPIAFRVIPPALLQQSEWLSPWRVVQSASGSPLSSELFRSWSDAAIHYRNGNAAGFEIATGHLEKMSREWSSGFRSGALRAEVIYNDWALFRKAIALYLVTLLLLLMSRMVCTRLAILFARGIFASALLLHGLALGLRIYIMLRPPVTTLYESILFVALVSAICCGIMEIKRRNGLSLFVGSIIAASLLFVSLGYAAEGDTLGVLIAVLNTNFWLATHVVCMTIGYGLCLVGGVLGHVYLFQGIICAKKDGQAELYQNIIGMSLAALFFSMFGTLLGGIWADQSWGRFWGWDPKENGALWVVLWLLFLLHGRLCGRIRAEGFALGMVFTNVVVALAWFGVNLLSVGLHSYGFTENIAFNLALFCGIELLVGIFLFGLTKRRLAATENAG